MIFSNISVESWFNYDTKYDDALQGDPFYLLHSFMEHKRPLFFDVIN